MDGQCRIAEYLQGALQGFRMEGLSSIINLDTLPHNRSLQAWGVHGGRNCRMENNKLPASIHYVLLNCVFSDRTAPWDFGAGEKGNLIT